MTEMMNFAGAAVAGGVPVPDVASLTVSTLHAKKAAVKPSAV